jgi:diguanylate cyclase (GGDEF)-like protein
LKFTDEVMFEYMIDTLIGMASAGVGSLLIFTINKRALQKADEATKIAESEAEKNRELNRTLEQKVLERTGELQASMEEVQYLATHDTLTGLPNRSMFSQLLNYAIKTAQRYQRQFAVLFIDLDRFKIINDTLGHEAGDQLLKEIATRLKQQLRAVDVVGRLGGDEFVILIEELTDSNQVATIAHKILTSVIKPITLMGQESRITASIGICMYPKDAADEQSLMKNADIAMYLAKEEGKNNYQFYSKDIQSKSLEHLSIETNLRFALERNELSLHYQAKVDFKTNMITGVEALLRWQSPYLGSVTPTRFISVAEESGLIIPIGRWVLKTACAQNVAWQQQGLPAVCMAVNLSLRQLTDDNLIDDIRTALNDSGMAPNLLELEITESMVMHNPALIISILSKIKSMGVRLAIDDFGTGYSSLAKIQRFPVDTLKIDRSFVRNIPQDAEDKAITEAIIGMGKTLSLTVVAEGVETEEQMNFLKEHSCDEMQGYYFSKPVVPEQFADLLREYAPFPAK